jgi:hypothetical protein
VVFATIGMSRAWSRVAWASGGSCSHPQTLEGWWHSVDADHSKYGSPEPSDEKSGKAAIFIVGALAVALVLFLLATGRVQIFH